VRILDNRCSLSYNTFISLMTDDKHKFKQIFKDLSDGNFMNEMQVVNLRQLTSHLEELYLQNEELQNRVRVMELELEWQQDYFNEQN